MKIPVAIYTRVSSEQQARTESISHQVSLLSEYMRRHLGSNYYTSDELIYCDEGISGYSTTLLHRPAIQKLLHDAQQHKFQVALFKEISRIGRDGEEVIKVPRILESFGVRVITTNDYYDSHNPDTQIFFGLSSILAEKESEKISTRVSSGNREKARAGKWATLPPFGYKLNPQTKKLEIDERTESLVQQIFSWYVHERIGSHSIAKRLNQQGQLTPKGYPFERAYVLSILHNPVYRGHVVYGKSRNKIERVYNEANNLIAKRKKSVLTHDPVIVYNAHPAIIDEALFTQAQTITRQRTSSSPQSSPTAKHPLVGIALCGNCGRQLICQKRTHQHKVYRYYKCSHQHRYGSSACSGVSVRAEKLEGFLLQLLQTKLRSHLDLPLTAITKFDSAACLSKQQQLERKRKALLAKQLLTSEERHLYADAVYEQKMLQLKAQIEQCQIELDQVKQEQQKLTLREPPVTTLKQLLSHLLQLDISNQSEVGLLFRELFSEVIVSHPDQIELIRYRHQL